MKIKRVNCMKLIVKFLKIIISKLEKSRLVIKMLTYSFLLKRKLIWTWWVLRRFNCWVEWLYSSRVRSVFRIFLRSQESISWRAFCYHCTHWPHFRLFIFVHWSQWSNHYLRFLSRFLLMSWSLGFQTLSLTSFFLLIRYVICYTNFQQDLIWVIYWNKFLNSCCHGSVSEISSILNFCWELLSF